MPTRVYDIDGTERSLEWLRDEWNGCEVLPARLTGGATEYWKLVAIYCTTGEVVLKVEARRGIYPADGQTAAFTYPRLNDTNPELPTLPASAHNWADRAIVQRTAASGVTGFVVNAWGPFYHAWIVSSVPSDCLSKTGMMGGTDHHGPLHGVWVLTPVAPVYATLDEALIGTCEAAQLIQFNPGAALQKAIFAAGFVPNSPEVDVKFGGISYRAQRAENLETGEVRAYYCRLDDWENVRYVVRPSDKRELSVGVVMASLTELLSAEFGADFEDISGALPKHASLRYTQRALSDVEFVVLHHTEAMRVITWISVAAYHVNSQGWPGIAYHIGVREAGGRCVVNLLNHPETRSYHSHTEGNDHGVAVCVAGKFQTDTPSAAEVDTLERVVAVLRRWATWRQSLPVLGHGEVRGNETDCPGANLKALLPALNEQPDLDTVIWQVAKANQVVRPNPKSAIEIMMREQGYTPIGNEADVLVDGVWRGVTQLGYYPAGGGELAFFATNLTANGQWTVRMVEA